MKDNSSLKTVVAMGVGGLIVYGVMSAIPQGQPSSQIEAYNNTIINIGGTVDFSADDIKAVLSSVTDRKSLAKEAVGAIKPAKRDPHSSIEVAGLASITMPPEAIREAPDKYEAPQAADREVSYTNVDLVIYASDRDNSESGWAGIAPNLVDKRTSVILADGIDPSKLHGRLKMKANILVHERFVASKKKWEPKLIEVLKTN